jgi:predicted MFS family arabinose efflux permease
MPLIGLAAEVHWRLAFVVLPLPAGVLAFAAFAARPARARERRPGASLTRLLREPAAFGWAAGEVLASAAWVGTLVFSGALLVEGHGASSRLTGVLLAVVAVAYLVGNQRAHRVPTDRTRRALAGGDLAAAAAVALLWAVRPNLAVTVALFCAAAYAAAARTLWATAYGFVVAREQELEAGAVRAVAQQLGYVLGSLLGGLALATGGYTLMGAVFGGLFFAAALPHLASLHGRARPGSRPLIRVEPAGA